MSQYEPHRWVIVKITLDNGDILNKVLGSWYGGYAGSDNWRFSSGITKVEDEDLCYLVHNQSGSIYTCYKSLEGMSNYTTNVYNQLVEEAQVSGVGKLEIINIKDIV
jgi:hypothetical protein